MFQANRFFQTASQLRNHLVSQSVSQSNSQLISLSVIQSGTCIGFRYNSNFSDGLFNVWDVFPDSSDSFLYIEFSHCFRYVQSETSSQTNKFRHFRDRFCRDFQVLFW